MILRRPLLFIAAGIVAAVLIEYYMGTASAVCAGAMFFIVILFMILDFLCYLIFYANIVIFIIL